LCQIFDHRPSRANEQKRIFSHTIQHFIKIIKSSAYTDINGSLLQASEYLNGTQSTRKIVIIFSDLQEELPKGYNRDFDISLTNLEVVALNVTKLNSDNRNPKKYMKRLDYWKRRVEASGEKWRIINDLERENTLAL
jgi:hypothetical protein